MCEIETMLAGGGFGRRGEYNSGLTVELAEVAKAIGPGRPVKLIWTREDDIRGGRYRPFFLHRMQGAVRDGKIVAWTNRIVGQSFLVGTAFEVLRLQGRCRRHDGRRIAHASLCDSELSLRRPYNRCDDPDAVLALGRPHPYGLCGRMLRR